MLEIRDGTPDLRHKTQCEALLVLLQEMEDDTPTTGVIQSALILTSEEVANNFGFTASASKYGPRINSFDSIVDSLKQEGFVEDATTGRNDATALTLTDTGKSYTQTSLTDAEEDCLTWVANRHATSGGKLLSFMYGQYPEYFNNSEL